MKHTLKVMAIVGTRPEIIRLSCVLTLLDKHVNLVLVHTGQNYDYELNEIFFNDLGIRKPDHFLNADVSSLGNTVGDIISKTEKVIKQEQPDAFLVLGDTNSCLSAYIAKRLRIPIYHMEAGNRCFDINVPEEINRKIIDHIADFNLVYTEHARRHLLSEGLPHRRIYLTGSPMLEVLSTFKDKIDQSEILKNLKLEANKYFVVSVHREENVDNHFNLIKILDILNALAKEYNIPVVVSTHPRARKQIDLLEFKFDDRIMFLKPFGFFDYVKLQKNSFCVISDSGTISEESAILSFPAVTLRNALERPEAMDTGSIILTGIDAETVMQAVSLSVAQDYKEIPADYTIKNTSQRVLNLIVGTAKLSNKWHGIEK